MCEEANGDAFHRLVPFLDAKLFSFVPCRGCQQEPPPMTSRRNPAFVPFRGALATYDPARFRPRALLTTFFPADLFDATEE
jgi:hypothetical protein